MDKTLFLCGFAVMMGIWNVYLARRTRDKWFWLGLGMIAFGIALYVVEKVLDSGLMPD